MKGLQHNVIEIRDTDNKEIERILVFLKPGEHKINISNTRQQARDILQKVKVKRTFSLPVNGRVATAIALAVSAVMFLVFALL